MLEKIFKSNLLYFFVVVYILLTFHTLSFDGKYGSFLFREDNYFEYIGFFSFFITSIVFFLAFYRIRKQTSANCILKTAILGLALLFFFGAGEEISWGQRIINIQTPEYLTKVNQQNEINVHNLNFGPLGDPFAISFDLFWMIYGVIIPFACFNETIRNYLSKYIPISHWSVAILFLLNYFCAKLAKLLYVNVFTATVVPFGQAVQEIKESNYGLIFALVALSCYFSLQNIYSQNK